MVKFYTFSTRIEADLAKGLLESEGIKATISADDQGGMRPSMTLLTGVDLYVNSEDLEKAKRILSDRIED